MPASSKDKHFRPWDFDFRHQRKAHLERATHRGNRLGIGKHRPFSPGKLHRSNCQWLEVTQSATCTPNKCEAPSPAHWNPCEKSPSGWYARILLVLGKLAQYTLSTPASQLYPPGDFQVSERLCLKDKLIEKRMTEFVAFWPLSEHSHRYMQGCVCIPERACTRTCTHPHAHKL